MSPREKTIRCRQGEVLFFSPPRGATWGGMFGMQVKRAEPFQGQAHVTAAQARKLAAELLRRADDLDSRRPSPLIGDRE